MKQVYRVTCLALILGLSSPLVAVASELVAEVDFKCTESGDTIQKISYAEYGRRNMLEDSARQAAVNFCDTTELGKAYDIHFVFYPD